MKKIIVVAVASMFMFGCSAMTKPSVKWLGGEVVVGSKDNASPVPAWVSNTELGLRSDGVVIWRQKK